MTTEKKIVREYSYEDETGKMLFQVLRYEPKGFSQRRPASFVRPRLDAESRQAGEADPTHSHGNWIYNTNGVRKLLYKLPELIATPLTEMVFIVEGEKDVERLMSLGIPATTNPGGTGDMADKQRHCFSAGQQTAYDLRQAQCREQARGAGVCDK